MQEKDGTLAAPGHPSPESSTLSAHPSAARRLRRGRLQRSPRRRGRILALPFETSSPATPAFASAGIRLLVPSPITLLGVDSGD
ncbi:hypothetical protein GGG16DRAFT_119825 [Schizophyllum commune]